MNKATILGLNCPQCEDSPLHEIGENEYGCDTCKNVYHIDPGVEDFHEKDISKDQFGNPTYPEEIL